MSVSVGGNGYHKTINSKGQVTTSPANKCQ